MYVICSNVYIKYFMIHVNQNLKKIKLKYGKVSSLLAQTNREYIYRFWMIDEAH